VRDGEVDGRGDDGGAGHDLHLGGTAVVSVDGKFGWSVGSVGWGV
jgi:hypothetical protein